MLEDGLTFRNLYESLKVEYEYPSEEKVFQEKTTYNTVPMGGTTFHCRNSGRILITNIKRYLQAVDERRKMEKRKKTQRERKRRGVRKKKRGRKDMMCRKRIKPDKRRSEEQRGGVEDTGKIKKEKVRDREKGGGGEKQRDQE